MRRIVALVAVAVAMVSLYGCGEKSSGPSVNIKGPDGKETKIEVKTK